MDHAEKISEILGFSGIEFNFGPYFNSKTTDNKGFQIDILFDRKDNVITLCEAKYSINPTGVDVIKEVEQKVLILKTVSSKNNTKSLNFKVWGNKKSFGNWLFLSNNYT